MSAQAVRVIHIISLLFIAGLLPACASLDWRPDRAGLLYVPDDAASLSGRFQPLIVSEAPEQLFNRIGRPQATVDEQGRVTVTVNPEQPVVYAGRRDFRTNRGHYRNLVYRIHFQSVPYSLLPFNLTAGRNVGLLFIVTLNDDGQPVLLTTVHTCGCYLAIIPTSFLPASAYPDNWDTRQQHVFGAMLPGLLTLPSQPGGRNRMVIYLRDETHRVIHVAVEDEMELRQRYATQRLAALPVESLKYLSTEQGDSVSFYYEQGAKKGYVRGAGKPFEFLFMSWWVLDSKVGHDKEYGDRRQTGTVFYTSLKPWQRNQSDMWNFADFLAYWGWQL